MPSSTIYICKLSIILIIAVNLINPPNVSAISVIKLRPLVVNNTIKFLFGPQVTVSKFPPIIELIVQRIQTYYSNYVYEDLSRPPTWDKPVYTLSPSDQQIFNSPSTIAPQISPIRDEGTTSKRPNLDEFIELPETSENFIDKDRKKIVATQNDVNKA